MYEWGYFGVYYDEYDVDDNLVFLTQCGKLALFKYLYKEELERFKKEIKSSDILLVNNEIPYNILIESIKYAKENNVYVILNPAPAIYNLNENTIETLKDMVKDIKKVNEDIMNLGLMLDGKINENEFVDLVK